MKSVVCFVVIALMISITHSVFAVVDPQDNTLLGPQVEVNAINTQIHPNDDDPANRTYKNEDSGFKAFVSKYGVNWDVFVDRATKRPTLIQGQGIPFSPGSANNLNISDIKLKGGDEEEIDIKVLERLARDFISNNFDLFRVDASSLRLNARRSGLFDNGNLIYVDFDYYYQGLPVENAHVFFRINNGNLIQFGSEYIDTPAITRNRKISSDQALLTLLSHLSKTAADLSEIVKKQSLIYLPEQIPTGYNYRLSWDMVFSLIDSTATFRGSVDARTGEILRLYDQNNYASVDGGILPRTATDAEVVKAFRDLLVVNGTNKCTDSNGNYSYTGGSSTSGLNGCYFNTNCTACSNPSQPSASGDASGNIHFGIGGTDAVGNGTSTKSDRNTFYHLNVARSLVKQYLTLAWFESNVGSNVNIDLTCNAFWNGSTVNFYRSGGGCRNSGEISDIIYHEWGHGLDNNDSRPIDNTNRSMSEAVGDITSFHVTHDRCMGPGFRINGGGETPTCPTAVRDLAYGPITASNVGSFCTPGTGGEYGYQVHCESHILSGALYDLANLLVGALGPTAGWARSEKLFFQTLPLASHMKPTNSSPWYPAVLVVDDDNGNLSDGTPNGCRIYQAFNAHGIASGPPVSCSAGPVNGATFVSQLGPPVSMTPGQSVSVSITMKNTGSTTWTTAAGYKLGSQNPQDNQNWGFGRVALPSSVAPNAQVTFTFNITAPSTPGNYNFQWRMLQEGVAWFGAYTPNIVVAVTAAQPPYPPGPRAIPGLIQAEHFDQGGEGVAYHDSDAANVGGQFRTSEGVDITTTADTGGGYIIGWTAPSEWLEYTVNVATAGTYTLEARVAAFNNGGTFHVEFNQVNVTPGGIAIPNTGGWDTWVTVRRNVTLSAGNNQIMRIAMDTPGYYGIVGNINHIRIAQYQGYLDAADCQYISGWAWDKGQPNTPINVDIYSDSVLLATYPANAFRQDLLNAGIGNGYHAFAYPVPASLKNGQPHSIAVKYSGTNDSLIGSPKSITCSGASISIVWIKPAEETWGPPGSLTAAGYALGGSGTVQLVWRNVTLAGGWNTVAYQATPGGDGSWSNSIPAPTNKCHTYQAYANYSGVSSAVFTYNGVTEGDCTIAVVSGTYGGNCGAPTGNATWHLAPACNGQTSCNYTVNVNTLGDPVPGCAKDYVARWTCGGGSTIRTATAPPEAGYGSVVNLVCN